MRCFMLATTVLMARARIGLLPFFVLTVCVLSCASTRAELYELDLHLHALSGTGSDMFDSSGAPISEAAPGGALLPVVSAAQMMRPSGTTWDFTGAASGSNLWVLPKSKAAGILFLGIGAEEIEAADLAGAITFAFQGLSGPAGGVFSMWDVGSFGNPQPLITSASGFGLPNALTIAAGGHSHFNYGFTAPGLYEVTFQATANLAASLGGGEVSGIGTFKFGVFDTGSTYPEPDPLVGPYAFFGTNFDNYIYGDGHVDLGMALVPVPEPSSMALAGLGAAGVLAAGYRRRRRAAGRISTATEIAG